MKKYYINTKDKGFIEVKGKPFMNEYGLDLFTHKNIDHPKLFNLSEGITGLSLITNSEVLKDLPVNFKDRLSIGGIKQLKRYIAANAKKCGISPRYKGGKK